MDDIADKTAALLLEWFPEGNHFRADYGGIMHCVLDDGAFLARHLERYERGERFLTVT